MRMLFLFFLSCHTEPKKFAQSDKIFPHSSFKKAKIASQKTKPLQTSGSFIHLEKVNQKDLQVWLNYFRGKGKSFLEKGYKNYLTYENIIIPILKQYNLPEDLIYVGLIESGYQLKANSPMKAVGPWQFIEKTGRSYGLQIDQYLDERQNIYKSTLAAAKYFVDLYNIFNSWELALSAYNGGEFGLINKIRRASTRDFKTLAQEKHLAEETIHYVPKVLAAKMIVENDFQYLKHQVARKKIKTLKINQSTSLKELAQKFKIDEAELKLLNADLKKSLTSPKGQLVLIPDKNIQLSEYRIQKAENIHQAKMIHNVKNGEQLNDIAKKYEVPLHEILELNALASDYTLVPGQKLIIKYL